MKKTSLLSSFRGGLALAAAVLLVSGSAQAAGPKAYRFTAAPANISGSSMTIDHPAFNGKRTVKPIITQFWDAIYNPHPVGVRYDDGTGRWNIVNEDGAAMPNGAKFNVLVAPATKQHLCSAANSFQNISFFQTAKNKPAARLLATHFINPVKNLPGTTHTKFFGTYYMGGTGFPYSGKWSVYNEDVGGFGTVAFNVADVTNLKIGGAPASFLHLTSDDNTGIQTSTITHPLTDNNPNAILFVKHLYIDGSSAVYVNKEVGVYYSGTKWNVFIEEQTQMPFNATFVVAVIPTATP